jgi:hypothetical protein
MVLPNLGIFVVFDSILEGHLSIGSRMLCTQWDALSNLTFSCIIFICDKICLGCKHQHHQLEEDDLYDDDDKDTEADQLWSLFFDNPIWLYPHDIDQEYRNIAF